MLQNGLETVVNESPRSNFLLANKEGLTSAVGFFALYLISTSVGAFLITCVDFPKFLLKTE